MDHGPNFELTELLRDGKWLRTFVRTLVPAREVDDLVQTTWLAALQQDAVVRSPQRWLRGIAANLARMVHRQRRRHVHAMHHVRCAEAETATADLVAGLEVQRVVSEALLDLPEPTRTILVLRYQQDLDSAEIAQRLGLQATAVRQRLHRGRELVRAKLQQRFGPGWRGCGAVLAFAGADGREIATTTVGGSMANAAVVLLLAGGLAGAGWVAADAATAPPPRAMIAATADAGAVGGAMTPIVDAAMRTLVAANEQDPAKPAAGSAIELRGRIVTAEDGSPLAGVQLKPQFGWHSSVPKTERRLPEPILTGADGKFVVTCPATAVSIMVWITAEGRCTRWYDSSPPRTIDLGDVPMTRGYAVRGRLVDEAGQPMEGVRVVAPIDGEFPKGGSISFPTKTAADGSFACRDPLPAGPFEFRSETRGVDLVDATVDIVAKAEPTIVLLHGRRLPSIRGVVFGLDGTPCPGVDLEALDPAARDHFNACGSGRSAADGSFEVFRTGGEAAVVRITTARTAAHEVVTELAPCAWGTSGLRLEVRPLIPVRLRVLEAGTRTAVERFAAFTVRQIGGTQIRHGGDNMRHHEGGLRTFEGLAAGTRIVLWAADEQLPPSHVIVDESMRTAATVDVEIARLQPFALTLVDMRGRALAIEFHVLDRCGTTEPGPWSDPRIGRTYTGNTCLRLSTSTTDAQGTATLMAPVDRRELVVAVRRGDRDVWLPLVLPAAGKPIRLVVPD